VTTRSPGVSMTRWLWEGRDPGAQLARLLLFPLSAMYYVVMVARGLAYRWGWRRVQSLGLPTVAVGNLTVGGAGKTPIASWIADWLLRRGSRPAILLRGYGGDEPLVHARLVPQAIIQANADRVRGAALARAAGAETLVLDDAFQTLGVARDVNLALVAVEQLRFAPWPLPAGPWREGWSALGRAHGIIVTRKQESSARAVDLAERLERRWPGRPVGVVHLALTGLEGLRSGRLAPDGLLQGQRVLAAVGVADPDSFAAQLRERAGTVQLVAYQDHHAYSDVDVAALLNAAATTDYLVVTEKDAVKLRPRWPADAQEPLVARLGVQWERGQQAFEALLSTLTDSSTPVI
jgi:tetraacyldisaccharide 4'-kinase